MLLCAGMTLNSDEEIEQKIGMGGGMEVWARGFDRCGAAVVRRSDQ